MNAPIPPKVPAIDNPEPWDIYWSEVKRYEKFLENQRLSDYRRDYYRKRTEERQIKKMKEFMDKYPQEALKKMDEIVKEKMPSSDTI